MAYTSNADKVAAKYGWIETPKKKTSNDDRRRIAEDLARATQKKKEPTIVRKVADIAFNRVPSALAGANIEAEKAYKQGISEWSPAGIAAGMEGFTKGITGEKRYTFSDYLAEKGMKEGAFRDTAGGLLDFITNPIAPSFLKGGVGLTTKAAEKYLPKLMPEAGKIAAGIANAGTRALGAGLAGGAIETGSAYGEGDSAGESLIKGAEAIPQWMAMDLGMNASGKGVGKILPNAPGLIKEGIGGFLGGAGIGAGGGLLAGQTPTQALQTGLETGAAFGGFGALTGGVRDKMFDPANVPIKKGMSGDDIDSHLVPEEPKLTEDMGIDFIADDPQYASWFNQEAFNKHRDQRANAVKYFYAEGQQESPFKPEDVTGQNYATDKFGEYSSGKIIPGDTENNGKVMADALINRSRQKALPAGINWAESGRFQATPDGKIMDIKEGSFPLAKIEGADYSANTGLQNRQRIAQDVDQPIPRSDIGDPAYLAEVQGKYNDLVKAEVDRLKGQVQGVEKYMPGESGPLLRSSLNAKWYRDFYAKNGRPPHEGEYRDMAISNLAKGVEDDFEGAIAPNNEFLSALSELSRGQKLPEEWHGLQQSIRDLESTKAEPAQTLTPETVKVGDTVYNQAGEPLKVLSIVNKNTMRVMDGQGNRAPIRFSEARAENKEIDPLLSDMRNEQAKVEPYGLDRDMGRLNEVENGIRGKTRMDDQVDYGRYEDVKFKQERSMADQEAVNNFVDEAITNRKIFKTLPLRKVTEKEVDSIKKLTDTDTTGYIHELSNNDLWHGFKEHSNLEIESQKGQIPITEQDLKRIPDIINNYDGITKGSSVSGRKSVIYNKRVNGYVYYVEVILPGKKVLRSKTMWKEPAAVVRAMPEASPHYTSVTDLSPNPSTELNISPDGTVGNISKNIAKDGEAKFKSGLTQTDQDLDLLRDAFGKRTFGVFKGNRKIALAPEAMERPEFQAAGAVADKLGLRLVTYRGNGVRGVQSGRTIYLNEKQSDPLDYIFWHETGHTMKVTHPEHYDSLMGIALEHVESDAGIIKHYTNQDYSKREIPDELAADVFAEALSTPGFFTRVAERSPELLKSLFEAINKMIENVKGLIDKNDSLIPYLKNVEAMRERIKQEVAIPYFRDAMGEKQFAETFGKEWSEPAAKMKVENAGIGIAKQDKINPTESNGLGDGMKEKSIIDLLSARQDGKVTTLPYRKNLEKSPRDTADSFAQSVEPKGDYINYHEPEWGTNLPNYEYGNISFAKPLVLEHESTGHGGWKTKLSEKYGGKTGTALANAVKKDGYDGIITVDSKAGEISEVVNLNGIKTRSSETITGSGEKKIRVNAPEASSKGASLSSDVRFKLDSKNPLEDFKAMVEYGAGIIGKANTADFIKMLESKYPDQLSGYAPEIKNRMISAVYNNAKVLNDTGNVEIKVGQSAAKLTKAAAEANNSQTINPVIPQASPNNLTGQSIDVSKIDTTSHIVSKTQRPAFSIKAAVNNVYVKAIDDVFRLNQFDKFVEERVGKILRPSEKSYKLALNSRGSDQVARTILKDKLVDSQGKVIGESMKSIISKIPKGKERLFEDYLVHRHAPSWTSQGRNVFPESWNITPEVSQSMVKNYEKYQPEFKQIADDLVQWQRDMGKAWLVDTGLVTEDAWKVFQEKYPDYVPLQRKMTELEQGGGFNNAKRGYANQTNPVKKAEGSERPIISPLESIIEHVDKYVKTAKRNQVMQVMIKNIQKDPEAFRGWAEIVPETRGKELDDLLDSGDLDGFITHMEKSWDDVALQKQARHGLDKANVVTGIVNGEKVHVRINDIGLLDALTNLNPQASHAAVEAFRQITRVMKLLTTGINPMFSIARNTPRDFIMGSVAGGEANPLRYTWDFLDSFARVVTNEKWHPDKFYQDYKAMGGGHSSSIASDRNLLAESKAMLLGTPTVKQKANAILSPLERLANATETIPRLPEYIRTVKEGGNTYDSRIEGLYRANDVTVNFNKRGQWGKDADAFIPYLNAALQGIDKLARLYKENPTAALAKSIVAITIPSISLYLLNRDNPDYEKLSSWVKDNNFCIPRSDGTFFKIAKPREAGIVFGSMIERAMRTWGDDDPEGFKNFASAWKTNFMPPYRPIFAPMYDAASNSDFAGRPIVPGYLQGRSPELQYDDTTSAPAKAIGSLLNESPKKIDYLASSYGGVLSDVVLPAASQGKGQNVFQRVAEPIRRGVIADPIYSNDTITEFYDIKNKLQTASNDFKATKQKSEYYKPGLARRFNSDATRISEINKQIRNINNNKDISYEAKVKRTKVLKERALKIAENALKVAK